MAFPLTFGPSKCSSRGATFPPDKPSYFLERGDFRSLARRTDGGLLFRPIFPPSFPHSNPLFCSRPLAFVIRAVARDFFLRRGVLYPAAPLFPPAAGAVVTGPVLLPFFVTSFAGFVGSRQLYRLFYFLFTLGRNRLYFSSVGGEPRSLEGEDRVTCCSFP